MSQKALLVGQILKIKSGNVLNNKQGDQKLSLGHGVIPNMTRASLWLHRKLIARCIVAVVSKSGVNLIQVELSKKAESRDCLVNENRQ